MLQLWIDVLDLIKHRSASQTYHKGHTISDLHMWYVWDAQTYHKGHTISDLHMCKNE